MRGEFMRRGSRFAVRVSLVGKKRRVFSLGPKAEASARDRAEAVCELAADLRRAKRAHTPDGIKLLELAALGNAKTTRGALSAAQALVSGELVDEADGPTFRSVADDWTSGRLHQDYPDHVKEKDSSDDRTRLGVVCSIEIDDVSFGDLAVNQIRVEHCQSVMRALPKRAKRPATRRHYAQVMSRVLQLCAYPLRLIDASPLPRGFLPKVGKPPAFHYLYPEDDRALLSCRNVDLGRRVYWGWTMREGGRKGETARLQVRDFDLKRGVVRIDENKTDDPRSWVMSPGTTEALLAWAGLRKLKPNDLVFRDDSGRDFVDDERTAFLLRSDLELAGIKESRPELFETTERRRRLRMHDLRGTFVTLSLAAGRSETWVQDRTGHRSSDMVNRYRRRAREAAELDLGELDALSHAIPELADWLTGRPRFAHGARNPDSVSIQRMSENLMIPSSTEGGTRTPTGLPPADFESAPGSHGVAFRRKTAVPAHHRRRSQDRDGRNMGDPLASQPGLAAALRSAADPDHEDLILALGEHAARAEADRAGGER